MVKFVCFRCAEWCELHDMRRCDCYGPGGAHYSASGTHNQVSMTHSHPQCMLLFWLITSVLKVCLQNLTMIYSIILTSYNNKYQKLMETKLSNLKGRYYI